MSAYRLSSVGVLLLAGWLASGGVASTRADEQRKNFVACPIVRDTASVPCWLAEYEGEMYFLTLQTDVSAPVTPRGKLFAGCYALYCGLVVIAAAGIVFAPVAHRILHRFHLEERE